MANKHSFSTNKLTTITAEILEEIKSAITGKEYGSVEIYIESGQVVQITERTIKKTNQPLRPKPSRAYTSTIKR